MAFAKLKALLRARAIRIIDALWRAIGEICDLFSPQECRNDFAAAGYGFIWKSDTLGLGFGVFDSAGPTGDVREFVNVFGLAAASAYGVADPEFVRTHLASRGRRSDS
jgi:hypothetical protein